MVPSSLKFDLLILYQDRYVKHQVVVSWLLLKDAKVVKPKTKELKTSQTFFVNTDTKTET